MVRKIVYRALPMILISENEKDLERLELGMEH